MAKKSVRQQKWEASLRVWIRAEQYTVWRTGYRARNKDQMLYVYPVSVDAEAIRSMKVRPVFVAHTETELRRTWADPASWNKMEVV